LNKTTSYKIFKPRDIEPAQSVTLCWLVWFSLEDSA